MHALKILHHLVARVLPTMHGLRQRTLALAVESLLRGRRLTLMELARSWPGATRVRAPLKRLDRLLSNPRLLDEVPAIEASLSQWLLRGPRPVVVVDWSELTRDGRWMVLRAGIPVGGRTLTLIERVYPASQQNSPAAQRTFLAALSRLVPQRVRLLVVTDAGFRSDWFRDVARHGWDFLGRIRNNTLIRHDESDADWRPCKSLHVLARPHAVELGPMQIVRGKPLSCRLILRGRHRKGRQRLGRRGDPVKDNGARQAQRREQEPWLLATSCDASVLNANQACMVYSKRMQIEQSFRDLKSHRFGVSFEDSLTRKPGRLQILLLLCTLATVFAWLIGRCAMLNASATRKVTAPGRRLSLSLVRIGRELALHTNYSPALNVIIGLMRAPPDTPAILQ